jgi:hypothetical protein
MTARVAASLLAPLALALCACGGSGSSSSSPRAAGSPATTAATTAATTSPAATPVRRHRPRRRVHHATAHRAAPVRAHPRATPHHRRGRRVAPAAAVGAPSHGASRLHVRPAGPVTATGRARIHQARAAIHALVHGLARGDASICTDLFTARMLRQTTKLSGQAALAKCQHDIGGHHLDIRLNHFEGFRLAGDRGLVQFTSSIGDYAKRQVLRLLYRHGHYLIDGAP